jgi:hypothetical protein
MMILMSVLEGILIGQGIFLQYHMSATGPPKQNYQRILLQLLLGCRKRSCVTPWYHIYGLDGFTADAVTGHSRRYQQPVHCFLQLENDAVYICLACLLIYI